MRQFKQVIAFAGFTLLLLSSSAQAELLMKERGEISSVNRSFIHLNDTQFRLSPTVKVTREDKKPTTLLQVKKGDYVMISLHNINKKKLVDSIIVLNGADSKIH